MRRFYSKRRMRWLLISGTLIVLLLAYFYLYPLIAASNKQKNNGAVAVVVAKTQRRDVPVYITALGSVSPLYSVTVRTQINGRLFRVFFHGGQEVKAGDVLAQIDPRPYEAQLVQLEGQLKRDLALLENAQIDLKRYQKLYPAGAVSQQTYNTQIALVKQYQGTVQADQGQIQGVKLNLEYCRITSPVNGKIGLRIVDPGNYVQTTDTNGIAVVNTIKPINVEFTVPEDDISEISRQYQKNHTLQVETYDRWQNKLLAIGHLHSIDNQVDLTTGTVKLKARFSNENELLFPNQFVNVHLLVTTLLQALVVPTASIQRGSQGTFVYLLQANNTVKVKPVTVSVTSGNDTVITSGLNEGQQVVIQGSDKLADGVEVTLMNNPQPQEPAAS